MKQKYLTRLKELDEFKNESRRGSEYLGQTEEDLGRSRQELIVLEHRLSAARQKIYTIQLLAKP